jgi:hypothetical protein
VAPARALLLCQRRGPHYISVVPQRSATSAWIQEPQSVVMLAATCNGIHGDVTHGHGRVVGPTGMGVGRHGVDDKNNSFLAETLPKL